MQTIQKRLGTSRPEWSLQYRRDKSASPLKHTRRRWSKKSGIP